MHKLKVFISSTVDLSVERDAVSIALSELDIDDERFEAWPSCPNEPIPECLQRVKDSHALVLILGKNYGHVTQLEYEQAGSAKRPVFAYLLNVAVTDPKQIEFIKRVEKDRFHCRKVQDAEDLQRQVTRSFLAEFYACFRQVHAPPEKLTPISIPHSSGRRRSLPDDPSQALEILETYYNSGADFDLHELVSECASKFRQHAEIMNYVFMAQVNLAMDGGLVASERLQQAVEFWDSPAARSRWSRAALLYNQANALKALNRVPEAIAKYRESLAVNPNFAPCWKNLGAIYLATEHLDMGRECCEEAIRRDPDLFEALYALGVHCFQQEHDAENALMYFDRIDLSKLRPPHIASVCGWKANILLKMGRYQQGIENAERAIAVFPEGAWGWGVASRLYALARREDKEWLKPAFSFWQRFVSQRPDSAEGWAELGFVCWFLRDAGDKDRISKLARTAFEKAVKLGRSQDGLIWDRIGHLHQEDGNWLQAEEAYRKAVEIDSAQFGFCLGRCLLKLGRHPEALPFLLAAAQKHQPDAMSWSQVALCYDKMGDGDKAVAAYEKAIELDPNYAHAWFELGGHFWNQLDIGAAIKVWREAIVRFPDHESCARVRDLLKNVGPKRE